MLNIGRILDDINAIKEGETGLLDPDTLYFVKGSIEAPVAGTLTEETAVYRGLPEQIDLVVTGNPDGLGNLDKVEHFYRIPSVEGPVTLSVGVPGSYWITNFDPTLKYEILAYYAEDILKNTTNPNQPVLFDRYFTYTPVDAASQGFTINGFDFTVEIVDPRPAAPVITSPVDGAVDINPNNILVTTSAFAMNIPGAEMDTLVSTDWEVATDPSFQNIVFSSYEDTVNLTSIVIP